MQHVQYLQHLRVVRYVLHCPGVQYVRHDVDGQLSLLVVRRSVWWDDYRWRDGAVHAGGRDATWDASWVASPSAPRSGEVILRGARILAADS